MQTMDWFSALRRNKLSSHERTRRNLKCYILHDPKYRTFWKRQNYGDTKKITGWRRWSDRQESTEEFQVRDYRV